MPALDLPPADGHVWRGGGVLFLALGHWVGKGIPESLAQAGAVNSLGVVPLIVLSRGVLPGQGQDWQRMQSELLELSSRSHNCSPTRAGTTSSSTNRRPRSGAIENMVEQTRKQASLAGR
jgi:hypothetical protein